MILLFDKHINISTLVCAALDEHWAPTWSLEPQAELQVRAAFLPTEIHFFGHSFQESPVPEQSSTF